ncbi:hypothetical protein K438DRAFT_1976462 [Mycena galopus ATCC 62051]|nr:hypothetical protein K438DRAFT_1976462 [Mycena galopus ATCC 62051]
MPSRTDADGRDSAEGLSAKEKLPVAGANATRHQDHNAQEAAQNPPPHNLAPPEKRKKATNTLRTHPTPRKDSPLPALYVSSSLFPPPQNALFPRPESTRRLALESRED